MKRTLILFTALSVTACQVPSFSMGLPVTPPAPLAATTVDDSALSAAWKAFDIALDGIGMLIDAKIIKPGSPKALRVADGVDAVTAALTSAETAAAAASKPGNYATAFAQYKQALAEAKIAIVNLRAALKGS